MAAGVSSEKSKALLKIKTHSQRNAAIVISNVSVRNFEKMPFRELFIKCYWKRRGKKSHTPEWNSLDIREIRANRQSRSWSWWPLLLRKWLSMLPVLTTAPRSRKPARCTRSIASLSPYIPRRPLRCRPWTEGWNSRSLEHSVPLAASHCRGHKVNF